MRTLTGMRSLRRIGDLSPIQTSLNTHRRVKSTDARSPGALIRLSRTETAMISRRGKSSAPGPRLTALAPSLLLAYRGRLRVRRAGPVAARLRRSSRPALSRLGTSSRTGPAPWAWNGGWWTAIPSCSSTRRPRLRGGALLHLASFDALGVAGAYQRLLWLAYLAPGRDGLARASARRRQRLAGGCPGAFVALTLSLWPALASGVEGGVHVGMAPARLAWALLPLLAARAARGARIAAPSPPPGGPLTAAIVLDAPGPSPAALALVALAALAVSPGGAAPAPRAGWSRHRRAVTGVWTAAAAGAIWTTRVRSPGAR